MKTFIRNLRLALVMLAWLMTTAHSQSFLTNGLVAYYPFNGNANDASGNGVNGTVSGATLTGDRFGNSNQAYGFDGASYIDFSSAPLNQTDNWTMSAWVNPASTNQIAMAVCLGFDDGFSGNGFQFGMTGSDAQAFNYGNHLAGFLAGVTWLKSGYTYGAPNVWNHIVMLRRSGVTYFYANGNEAPITSTSTPLAPTAFRIGSATGIRFFNGAIDDVRIYNRALSSNEVAQLYAIESGASLQLTNLLISPANPTISVSSNQQFTATGYYSDGSSQTLTNNLLWSSSSTNVASITTDGLASGLAGGATTIKAMSGSVSNSTILTVLAPPASLTNIVVSPVNPIIAVSSNLQFTATGHYDDGSVSNLTSNLAWFSSSSAVATISISGGLASGLTNGVTTITATSGSVNGNTTLTVVAPPVIASQSTNGTITANGNVTLSVGATGGGLSYQWRFNGTNIVGATNATLTFTNYSAINVGVYTVVISNAAGSVTSLPIVVATTAIEMFAGVIVNGPVGSNYLIQASYDLSSWVTVTNIALPTQPYVYIDYSTPFNSHNNYRAVPNWTNTTTLTDIGVSWTPQNSGSRQWQSVASSSDGIKLVTVVIGGQIYTSTNLGVTWTPRDSNRNWTSVTSSTDGSKLVAVVTGGQIYTSTDSGANWTPHDSSQSWVSVASSADGVKLIAADYGPSGGGGPIYTSTNSGATWTPRNISRNWRSVASSADGNKLVAVVENGQIYTSADSGMTWTPRESSRNWWSVASSADGSKLVAVVAGGQVYTSTDSGVTWTPRDSSRSWHSVASSADGSKLVAVVAGGQVYTSTDSGMTWTPHDINRSWYSVACSSDCTKIVAVVFGGQIYTSTP